MTSPDDAAPPEWFRTAVATFPAHRDIEVEGARVHYRAWGDPALPGLVLVHGGAAHSGWWDHIGPQLSSHRVVAPRPHGARRQQPPGHLRHEAVGPRGRRRGAAQRGSTVPSSWGTAWVGGSP